LSLLKLQGKGQRARAKGKGKNTKTINTVSDNILRVKAGRRLSHECPDTDTDTNVGSKMMMLGGLVGVFLRGGVHIIGWFAKKKSHN